MPLQRMSGVTIQRDKSGEGRYAIIRGMNQRYNNTLVNGIKIPSPDDKFRFVPMDIFPSEMLQRLEVIKSLTPDMEGDAIGGTMNLVMKSAPDRFLFTANVAGGYTTLFSQRPFSAFSHSGINRKSPAERHGNDYAATYPDFTVSNLMYNSRNPKNETLGATVGDRFFHKKLGVILSASYQNFYRGSNSDYLIPNAQPNFNPSNEPVFSDIYNRQFSTQKNRIGIHNKIDFVINSKNKISLYNLYVHQNEYQTRYTEDTVLGINSTSTLKLVDIENRSQWKKQTVYNATLQGEHQLSHALQLTWSAVYSKARKEVPDMAWFVVENDVHQDANSGKVTSVDSIANSMHHLWQHNSDRDLSGYANLLYNVKMGGNTSTFSVGGMYRHKTRDNYYNEYSLVPTPIGTQQPYSDIRSASFGFTKTSDGTGNSTAQTPDNYSTTENVDAGYVQAKLKLTRQFEVLGGVRIEHTEQTYSTVMPENFNARYGTIKYTDVLPGIHLKYALSDRQNLRLSYFKSISRPGFGEVVPYLYPGDYFDEIGNPYLKHTRADNLDFRYELFPGGADQVLLGAFYKEIQDPIEYFVVRGGGPSAQFIKPANVDKATNFGFEAVVTRYFGKFGVSANYTYTHSRVTTDKLNYHYDATLGNTQDIVSETRPLQGQADHVGNLSLLYKDPKAGLDAQIAFVYTGQRIVQVSPYYGLDFWEHPYSQLDVSLEKRITKRLSFYAKVNNLTNAPHKVYLKYPSKDLPNALPNQDDPDRILVQKDIYKVSLLGGFRFKF